MTETSIFGLTTDGREVRRYRLRNKNGLTVDLLDLGCIIQSLLVPDGRGGLIDVVLGYDSVTEYENDDAYFGALIGRWANRVSGAAFELNGRRYSLAANDGPNHLHGGPGGFSRRLWAASVRDDAVVFSRLSPDGEEGYPGDLRVEAVYRLTDEDSLIINYEAESDRDTVVNLTNHSYFNLKGEGDILDHRLRLRADFFSEVDSALIPTGRLLPTAGGAFDFLEFKAIGQDIEADYAPGGAMRRCGHWPASSAGQGIEPPPQLAQLKNGRGYDHNFVLNEGRERLFAEVASPRNGLAMHLSTSLPGVQFYSGNALSPRRGKGGLEIGPRSGFCLETQLFPDSLNSPPGTEPEPRQPSWPSPVLRKGEVYRHFSAFKFIYPGQ